MSGTSSIRLPVPGGMGVLDTLLVAGELLDGASTVPAIVACCCPASSPTGSSSGPGLAAYWRLTRQQEPQTA